ncbi:hypothetical protein ABXS75_10470 [Roseburia hominis]
MKRKVIILLSALTLVLSFSSCGKKEQPDTQSPKEDQKVEAETLETDEEEEKKEENKEEKEEEIVYISCSADEMMQEFVDDFDAAKEKYADQYVKITGTLKEFDVDEDATPKGRIIRLDTSLEIQNAAANISGITWEEEDYPMEEFEKDRSQIQPGDTVTMLVHIDEYSLERGHSFYDFLFDLYGIEK